MAIEVRVDGIGDRAIQKRTPQCVGFPSPHWTSRAVFLPHPRRAVATPEEAMAICACNGGGGGALAYGCAQR